VGGLGAGLVFATAAGALAGRTDAAMREVFAVLTRLGGVGFGGFGAVGAGEGLETLRAGVVLRGGAEAFGGTERGAGWLGLDELGLTFAGGGLPRCGRAEALGAGWGLLGCAGLAAGARLLPTFEGLLLLGAGDDF
jgi:hypothetical protein